MDAHTEQILHRLNRQATCVNPSCDASVRVAGEFCPSCVAQQRQTREALRRVPAARERA